jgi:hypothetical protein
MSNWITHVKDYASKNKVSYKQAMKDSRETHIYKGKKEGAADYPWQSFENNMLLVKKAGSRTVKGKSSEMINGQKNPVMKSRKPRKKEANVIEIGIPER